MFALGVRFSRISMSGALLLVGAPLSVNAADCNALHCLTTPLANMTVDNGDIFAVGAGGNLSDSSVSFGEILILEEGVTSGTTVSNSGRLTVLDDGKAFDSLVENGVMVVAGSATALNTHILDGDFEASQNAVVSDTAIDGGTMYVFGNATSKNTRIANSAVTVYESGNMQNTVVNDGGTMSLSDRATASDTQVNQGGVLDSVAGTRLFNTTVNRGGLMVLGDRASASDTTLNDGGVLKLKGDAIFGGSNRIDGQVAFADPAVTGTFHTLNINGPLSGSGTFLINTDLAALRGDRINVQGPISDLHTLVVADSGTAPTGIQQSLMLVNGHGGSGDFQLYGSTVDAGAYRYSLQKQGDDWYLAKPSINTPDVSIEEPQTPPPAGKPDPGVEPALPPAIDPVVKPGLPPSINPPAKQADSLSKGANAAVAGQAAAAALLGAQAGSLHQHFSSLRSGKDQGGLWSHGYGAEQRIDTDSSRAFEQQVNGVEIGVDQAFAVANGTLYVGGLVGQGRGLQDFGERSSGTIDSVTLGGYASYQDHDGIYIDTALKYSRLNNDIKITSNLGDPVKAHYRNHAWSADAQVGKVIELDRGWFVEPQVGVQVARISGGSYTASNGLAVEQEAMVSLQSRVGAQFGRQLQLDSGLRLKPYVKATWVTEHAGDSTVKVNGSRLDSRLPGSRVELAGGLILAAGQNHHVYVEGQYVEGSDIKQPWAATVGYRYSW